MYFLFPNHRLFGLTTICAGFLLRGAEASASVNVELQASFDAPPYILELLETAADENSTSYFHLLDRIAEGRFAECSTDQETYQTFLKVLQDDGHIATQEALSSFQFALSIHSAAPRIEAHYHYYDSSVEPSLMIAQDAACPVWVHFDGKQYCSPALDRAQQDVGEIKNIEALPFDRVLGSTSDPASTSILYADINSPLFAQFHQTISQTAREGHTSYRIRYRRSPGPLPKRLAVNGYGVELALKRTDYIVIDDREKDGEEKDDTAVLPSSHADQLGDEEMADLKPLSASELLGLGLKTSSYIMESDNPFETLERVSQDFPKYSSFIAKKNASSDLVEEHISNRELFLPAGYNVVWMNGQQIQSREMNAFSLLEQLRRERNVVGNLKNLGFTGPEAVEILSHSTITESKSEDDPQRYDYRDAQEGDNIIMWLNDIEKDKRYNGWPKQSNALLQRLWPGQLPQVRRDIHNVIIPINFAETADVDMVVQAIQQFVKRKVPVRFGLVPIIDSKASIDQAKILYHLLDTYGLGSVFAFLEECLKSKVKVTARKQNFDFAIQDRTLRKDREAVDYTSILESEDLNVRVQSLQTYAKRLGINGPTYPFFANGIALSLNDEWLSSMSTAVDGDYRRLQREVYEQEIPDDVWLAGRFLENATLNRNSLIIPEDENSIDFIDLGSVYSKQSHLLDRIPRLKPSVSEKPINPQMILVANLDSKAGLQLLSTAITFYHSTSDMELIIVHNQGDSSSRYFPVSVFVADRMLDEAQVLDVNVLDSFLALQTQLASEGKLDTLNSNYPEQDPDRAREYWAPFQSLVKELGVSAGAHEIIINGRVVGPIPDSADFSLDDFNQLLRYERKKRLDPAETVLSALSLQNRIKTPDQGAIVVSVISLSTISDIPEGIFDSAPTLRMDKFTAWAGAHTLIQSGDPENSSIYLVATIDPTSQIAQRWIPILRVLSELGGVHLKLYLNPKEKIQELPIKRFYRHVLDSKPTFTENGEIHRLAATFDRLPKDALLNLALDVPPAWLVAPKESIHDLDNIKLSALKEGANVDAIYELEYILIEGHSREVVPGPPPRGVKLVLGTEKDPYFADTIIMANIGYFQFKANPGFWNLRLQEGRSSKIFNIESAGQLGYNPEPGDESPDIALMSFQGKTLYPRLSRRPGQETEDVLEEGGLLKSAGSTMQYVAKASNFASSVLSKVGLAPSPRTVHADINIFSVASGHLYERMLNIMMVSVLRHTTHTVKFWFIAQFLSPSFKASLPYLSAHYNFSYELITYKWPHWLRQQSEKQREIWGYKILFLDVLFPTSLDKVIFVDADQIVRTDMYDLVQLDLEGAPYGFTPMCDSRTSMEGFRFWKQGYWANFLRGLPYHISALYVVDLHKFRQIAAGDRLRGQYHQLSADPGSLSNLDQDLPNHMQHVLPIKSLPQEWLWCETWCSDEELTKARTIDLCNNPQTKEPKLSRARRQVPEWTELDEEIAGVLRGVSEKAGEVRGGVQEVMIEGSGPSSSRAGSESESNKVDRDGNGKATDKAEEEKDNTEKKKEKPKSIKDEL